MDVFAKDTDGFFARNFDRKISGAISRFLIKTPITPNQITIGVTFIGLGSGYLLAQPGYIPKVAGAFVFLLTSILDGCDGEVTRAKKMTSKLGGWLDLWGDNVVHVAVFYGLGCGLSQDLGTSLYRRLGLLACLGTVVAAGLASVQTWRKGKSSFTSVSGDITQVPTGWQRHLTRASDALARRDFVYAVPLLALVHGLPLFLWLSAIGANVYALVLVFLLTLFIVPMKILRWLGLLLGLSIAGVLIHHVGWASIKASLSLLGWDYVIVLAYPLSWILLNTQGWRSAVALHHPEVSFKRLFQIRLAGESFNALLPSGYVGGEPLKAKLLSAAMPLREAAASVLVAKAAQSVGLVVFIGLGLALGGRPGTMAMFTQPAALGALLVLAVGISLFVLLLSRRGFSRAAGFLHRHFAFGALSRALPKLAALDDSLGVFYRQGRRQFFWSIFWHGCGWMAGALELVVLFSLIDHPVTWREAWFIGAFAQLGSVIGLFAPAGVGLYEGGHYLAAQLLGLPPALGITVALIRRVRELFWNVIGLLIFWKLSKSRSH